MSGYLRPSRGVVRPQRGEARPTMLRSVNYGSTQSFAGGRVAVMPSLGRIQQLSVLGVTAVVLGVSAHSASAAENDVWLWSCHSPTGQALDLDKANTHDRFDWSVTPGTAVNPFGDECKGTGNTTGG